jgi:hypothetical protein
MKRFLTGLCMLAVVAFCAAQTFADGVVDYEYNLYTATVDDEFETVIEFDVAASDTVFFSRHMIDFDESLLSLDDIEQTGGPTGGSNSAFINWDGAGDAEVIWLGQWFDNKQHWEGEAFTLTWTALDACTNEPVEWIESPGAHDNNYVDLYAWYCDPPRVSSYRKLPGNTYGGCIPQSDFFGTKVTIYDLMAPKNAPTKDKDRPELSPGKAKQDRAARIAAFNARQEERINAMSPLMQEFIRDALAGENVTREQFRKAAVENSTWSETKILFR